MQDTKAFQQPSQRVIRIKREVLPPQRTDSAHAAALASAVEEPVQKQRVVILGDQIPKWVLPLDARHCDKGES